MRRARFVALLVLALCSSTAFAQTIDVAGVPAPHSFTRAGLRAMPNRVTRTIGGKAYAGVLLADLLRAGGIDLDKLKGKDLARSFVVTGSDGYAATFALAEAIARFHDVEALLADTVDGKDLSAEDGPFHVMTLDKTAKGRWVRNAVKVTLQP
jgi:hypothetical protein